MVLVCLITAFAASPVLAQQAWSPSAASPLQIVPSMEYEVLKTTDSIFFDTVVTNDAAEPSPPIIVAMNIINLDKEGDVVDPEDWSPQRTQYIDQLAPGQSATLPWRVNAILDGDYIIYMVAMPQPTGQEQTSQAVASKGIHLTVLAYTRLNPGGVLPYALGGPIVLGLALMYVSRLRSREIDVGASS
jgi:hypothetical protein